MLKLFREYNTRLNRRVSFTMPAAMATASALKVMDDIGRKSTGYLGIGYGFNYSIPVQSAKLLY